jgi:hypothetical protein
VNIHYSIQCVRAIVPFRLLVLGLFGIAGEIHRRRERTLFTLDPLLQYSQLAVKKASGFPWSAICTHSPSCSL